MKRHDKPAVTVTDKLRSYDAALKVIGNAPKHEAGRLFYTGAENFHLPFRRRRRAMLRFGQMRCPQKFSIVHASVYIIFNAERARYSRQNFKRNRGAALAEWCDLCAA